MKYRVGELSQASGLPIDTIRFYQSKGLLPAPRRAGRVAIYDDHHLERLQRIRELRDQGFRLDQIRRVLEAPEGGTRGSDPLLTALLRESVGTRTLDRAELAREAGVPEVLVGAAISSGLIEPIHVDGEERFSEADAEMARAGLALLGAGFPMDRLLGLSVGHARNIQEIAEAGIDLFDEHVRKSGEAAGDAGAISEVFRDLLPVVTRLVALHFQRTLVTRALQRLRRSGEDEALEQALAATESASLEVRCRWR